MSNTMTLEQHKERHVQLQKALDELFADYILCHPDQHRFLQMQFGDFLNWSFKQITDPETPPSQHERH